MGWNCKFFFAREVLFAMRRITGCVSARVVGFLTFCKELRVRCSTMDYNKSLPIDYDSSFNALILGGKI